MADEQTQDFSPAIAHWGDTDYSAWVRAFAASQATRRLGDSGNSESPPAIDHWREDGYAKLAASHATRHQQEIIAARRPAPGSYQVSPTTRKHL